MDQRAYLDLLFAGFEKRFGAYRGRQQGGVHTLLALAITLAVFAGVLLPFVPRPLTDDAKASTLRVEQRKVVQYSQLSAPPPIELIEEKAPQKREPSNRPVATKKFVAPTVRPDQEVSQMEALPSQDELKYVNPDTKTQEGDSLHQVAALDGDFSEVEIQYDLVEAVEVVPPSATPAAPKAPPEEIYSFVEKRAEFPGGQAALMEYFAENIEYPAFALENNIQGRVIVQFIIEKDGSITNIEVVRDLGGNCGREAVRVIRKMPNWQPAQQNDRTVRSKFVLPVTFKIID